MNLQITGADPWTPESRLFKAVTESTTLIAWATAPDGHCFYLSPQWYKFTGMPTDGGLGFNWLMAIHPDDASRVRRAFFEANDQRLAYGVTYRLTRPDGSYALTWAMGLPKFTEELCFQGFFGTLCPLEAQHNDQVNSARSPVAGRLLTDREREVLTLIADGNTAKVVASRLGITRRTVETHVSNAALKLEGSNRLHTVVKAIRMSEI